MQLPTVLKHIEPEQLISALEGLKIWSVDDIVSAKQDTDYPLSMEGSIEVSLLRKPLLASLRIAKTPKRS